MDAQGAGAPPLRAPTGVSRDRLSLILAVLCKHTPMNPFSVNVHTNVVGGLQMRVRLPSGTRNIYLGILLKALGSKSP